MSLVKEDRTSPPTLPTRPAAAEPNAAVVGLAWAVLSAVSYSVTNICLRTVAEDYDPTWVSCMRATPSAILSVLLCGTALVAWRPGICAAVNVSGGLRGGIDGAIGR